jgi:hypothetical protein
MRFPDQNPPTRMAGGFCVYVHLSFVEYKIQ